MNKVQEFVDALNSDPALQQQADAATAGVTGDMQASIEAIATVAAGAGFDISSSDIETYYQDKLGTDGELSEDALEAITGGASQWWFLRSGDSWIFAIVSTDEAK